MSSADVQMVAGVRMMVKNTFLEVAEAEEQPQIWRSKTEPAATFESLNTFDLPDSYDSPDSDSESVGVASTASAATASSLPTLIPTEPVAAHAAGGAAVLAATRKGAVLAKAAQPEDVKQATAGAKRPGGASARSERRAGGAPREEQGLTTVMLRNLPNDYTRGMLQKLLEKRGFAAKYDFLYLPIDFTRKAGLGYAFVNMLSAADAQAVRHSLEGYRQWSIPSTKVCCVGWSNPCQGLESNIERYRNSPVMHASVPDEYKPILLSGGKRIAFPEPTRTVQRPTQRKSGQ